MNHFGSIDELELNKRHDAIAIERRLEGEVEPFEGLSARWFVLVWILIR
jgi:hypothetical protein